ncbi:MAG: hypothetical protein QM753_16705 [Thermomicrobiales bacterium]
MSHRERVAMIGIVSLLSCMSGTSYAAASPVPAATPVAGDAPLVAYQWEDRIHLVQQDGGHDRLLTPAWNAGPQLHPDWSPDGSQLAFTVDDEDGTRDLWIVSVDGSDPQRIVDCQATCVAIDDPAWSPDGSTIAYSQFGSSTRRDDGSLSIVTLATGETHVLFTCMPGDWVYTPRWSPDGSQIVFELDHFADPSVDSSDIVGSGIALVSLTAATPGATMLTDFDTFSQYPDWQPGGDLIVFAQATPSGLDGPFDLYTIDPTGKTLTQVTTLGGTGFQAIQPTWSPDGLSIIFVHDEMWTSPTGAVSPGMALRIPLGMR